MTAVVSTERVFSLPCFEGLRLLRQYKAQYPRLVTSELLTLIENVEADGRSLDLEAAVHLDFLAEHDCPLDGPVFYQSCIKAVLLEHQPIWSKAMRSGRKRFVQTLDANDQDVFAAAGLMEEPPSSHIVTWWDEVSGHARLIIDREKMARGRRAELLTINSERERLSSLGIDKEPEWLGFDDNFAGYDVLSYDYGKSGIVSRLIEVKSTIASPLRFYVTHNEWERAEKAGDAYIFHVWDLKPDPPKLYVQTIVDVAPHIPTDNEEGSWVNATIPIVNS